MQDTITRTEVLGTSQKADGAALSAEIGKLVCKNCGSTRGVFHAPELNHAPHCATCASMFRAGDDAEAALTALVAAFIPEWAAFYLARGAEELFLQELLAGGSGVGRAVQAALEVGKAMYLEQIS